MTIILGIIQLALILYICIFEFNNKSSSVFLWATLAVMFGMMHFLTSIKGDAEYSNDVLNVASLFVIAFCLFYIAVRMYLSDKYLKGKNDFASYEKIVKETSKGKNYENVLLLILLLVVILKLVPFIIYSGSILNTSWRTGRNYSATLGYLNMGQLYNIIFYSLAGIMTISILKNNKKCFIASFVIVMIEVLLTRNRIEILPILCATITIFVLKNRKISFKTMIACAILAFLTIYIVYGIRVYRHYGSIGSFISKFNLVEFTNKIFLYLKTGNGELGLRRVFYYFIANNNNFPGFGEMRYIC